MSHQAPVPGYVVAFSVGARFTEGLAVRLGIHPAEHVHGEPCIGSHQPAPPLPLSPPTAALGLALQRAVTEPAQAPLFDLPAT